MYKNSINSKNNFSISNEKDDKNLDGPYTSTITSKIENKDIKDSEKPIEKKQIKSKEKPTTKKITQQDEKIPGSKEEKEKIGKGKINEEEMERPTIHKDEENINENYLIKKFLL